MYKHRRKITMIIAVILAALLIFSFVAMAIPAFALTQSDLNTLKKKRDQRAADKKVLDNELYSIRNEKKSAIQEKENLDKQIEILNDQIALTEEILALLEEDIEVKIQEIDSAKIDEQEEFELFKKRVRGMEESGHISTWAVLLGAESFSDYLARSEVIGDLIMYDRNLMQSLKTTRERIEQTKAELEEEREYYVELLTDYESQREEKQSKVEEQEKFIENLQAKEQMTAEQLNEIAKQIAADDKQIDTWSKELAKRATYVGGDYIWPLPAGNTTITCPYGYRTHPVTKQKNSLHTGTDIAAKQGTEIYAANAGTIIVSEYSNSWGYYIMIDHGGGNVSLYAHMKSKGLGVNKEVKQGQVIGYVGSTGWSTGPHLHFELRKDGVAYDVMKNVYKKVQ